MILFLSVCLLVIFLTTHVFIFPASKLVNKYDPCSLVSSELFVPGA